MGSFAPGDIVLFKRGEMWREQLTVPSSGIAGSPITFGAYGSGAKPELNGSDLVAGSWSNTQTNVWQVALTMHPNILFADNELLGENTASPSTDKEWHWASNILSMYSATDPGKRFSTIEAGARNYAINSRGKNYIEFNNISLVKCNASGAMLNLTTYHTFDGLDASYNYIRGIDNRGDATDKTNNITIKNGEFSYNGIAGIEFHGGAAFGLLHDLLIHGNSVHHNGWQATTTIYTSGIKIWGGYGGVGDLSYSAIIENNTVYNNSSAASHLGSGIGIWVDEWGTGAIVRNNLVYNNDMTGICLEHHNGSTAYYNILYENSAYWAAWPQLLVHRSSNGHNVYNNTVYGGTIAYGVRGAGATVTMVNNTLKNNIAFGYSGQALSATLGGENKGSGSGNVYTYNAFGPEAPNFIEWENGVYKSTYVAFDYAYGSATHSITADPLFVSTVTRDFSLQPGSPARDAGTGVGLTSDYLGNKVPMGNAVDIGAYEYQGGGIIIPFQKFPQSPTNIIVN